LYPQDIESEIRFDTTALWCQIKLLMVSMQHCGVVVKYSNFYVA